MAEKNGVAKGFVIGLLAGSAIGAILALLYAPKSGRELRSDIKAKTDELMDNAETMIQKTRTRVQEAAADARRRSEQVISDVKTQADTLMQDADRVLNTAKQRTGSILEEGMKVKDAVKAGVEAFKQERDRTA
ncbi:MAG: YtxH domain-containing protein [Ignavibacteriae bacterium]|nr:YtxH domain-containing protein [Ignavibacteriota bacterium]